MRILADVTRRVNRGAMDFPQAYRTQGVEVCKLECHFPSQPGRNKAPGRMDLQWILNMEGSVEGIRQAARALGVEAEIEASMLAEAAGNPVDAGWLLGYGVIGNG